VTAAPNPPPRILVVDDDPALALVLEALLRQAGYSPRVVPSAEAALVAIEQHAVDAILSDVKMPGMDGLELLRQLRERRPDLPVVLLTAHGTVPLAVEAMKCGAADFLLKPFDRDEILFVVRKALAAGERGAAAAPALPPGGLIGDSPAMREVRALVERSARGLATVMIRGESGTGKELVARAVHDGSPRCDGPLVKIHCAALPETLLESELFGYEKGAFTGAATTKPGRVELADGGTLFLDEIGEIPLAMQVKLLRLIQEKEFERLGGRQTLRVDVRFVAATHRPLEEMMARGMFREDLFYRLNVVPVWLPPLREREGDVSQLARRFWATHGRLNGRSDVTIDDDAVKLLEEQPWPGNVRQLENFIERLVVLADGSRVDAAKVRAELARQGVPAAPAEDGGLMTLGERRRQSERGALQEALKQSRDNRTVAARLLGISRRTLYTKLEEHGLL
jgi:two-component system, NtrC family, response regulator AtoC